MFMNGDSVLVGFAAWRLRVVQSRLGDIGVLFSGLGPNRPKTGSA